MPTEQKVKFAFIALGMVLLTLLIGEISDGACKRELRNTKADLASYQYALSHGILPSRNMLTCRNGESTVPVEWNDSRGGYVIQDALCKVE